MLENPTYSNTRNLAISFSEEIGKKFALLVLGYKSYPRKFNIEITFPSKDGLVSELYRDCNISPLTQTNRNQDWFNIVFYYKEVKRTLEKDCFLE